MLRALIVALNVSDSVVVEPKWRVFSPARTRDACDVFVRVDQANVALCILTKIRHGDGAAIGANGRILGISLGWGDGGLEASL